MIINEETVEERMGTAATSAGPSADLSPSVARSVGAVLHERRLSWREALDDSALVTGVLLGAATALLVARALRRR